MVMAMAEGRGLWFRYRAPIVSERPKSLFWRPPSASWGSHCGSGSGVDANNRMNDVNGESEKYLLFLPKIIIVISTPPRERSPDLPPLRRGRRRVPGLLVPTPDPP